ncbi:MAG TPA: hypothetical protein VNX68_09525 [Nitrosopumilaceae archaeon]|jgi:hypothetical protein|nr:hypothetical protein [Nitrosopumilaceae archaeon]
MTKHKKRVKLKSGKNARGSGKFGWTEAGKNKKTFSRIEQMDSIEKDAFEN